ncbi:hypothetical protein B0H17DRAFT_1214861 [Mycena rosella]|uniref:Uncharacterized protein n=1 Tax=Mycena rosella TaxID=1033263 RepID=A0AAD7G3I5_MYCRO|nr:hypothetical protein B0H17DRAFT_1214861 [Mycena rosella]
MTSASQRAPPSTAPRRANAEPNARDYPPPWTHSASDWFPLATGPMHRALRAVLLPENECSRGAPSWERPTNSSVSSFVLRGGSGIDVQTCNLTDVWCGGYVRAAARDQQDARGRVLLRRRGMIDQFGARGGIVGRDTSSLRLPLDFDFDVRSREANPPYRSLLPRVLSVLGTSGTPSRIYRYYLGHHALRASVLRISAIQPTIIWNAASSWRRRTPSPSSGTQARQQASTLECALLRRQCLAVRSVRSADAAVFGHRIERPWVPTTAFARWRMREARLLVRLGTSVAFREASAICKSSTSSALLFDGKPRWIWWCYGRIMEETPLAGGRR